MFPEGPLKVYVPCGLFKGFSRITAVYTPMYHNPVI